MPVSLNTFNVTSLATLDKRGGLYKTSIPFDENTGTNAQEALVYSATKLSNNRPAPVATPLPPLNLRVTGKRCPRIAKAPHM